MAKTPKVKKRAVSVHSRAARRGTSPTATTTAAKAPTEQSDYQPWLHSAHDAGISKKKKGKPLSRQQRLRQQRGMEKADATLDKLEKKVADSKVRARKIDERRMGWEELNEKVADAEGIIASKAEEQARQKAIREQKAAEREIDTKVDGLVDILEDVEFPISEAPVTDVTKTVPAAAPSTVVVEQEEEVDEIT